MVEVANVAGFKFLFTTNRCNRLPLKDADVIALNRFMARAIGPIFKVGIQRKFAVS